MGAPRYSGRVRRGTSRPLTQDEQQRWTEVAARWHSTPPKNDHDRTDNQTVKMTLVDLFEDGVSLPTLARAANWGMPKIGGILHRCREEGITTNTRRLITADAPERTPAHRTLTADENAALAAAYAALPARSSNGARDWRSAPARDLLRRVEALVSETVALESIAAAFGMSRQAVHQHLRNHRQTAA